MKQELQEQLFQKYPDLFVEKDLPMSQTCMGWGIDTGDGWYDLLADLCVKISHLCGYSPFMSCVFTQVKEKYGTLRVYFATINGNIIMNNIIDDLIDAAESRSAHTCKVCGEYGEPNDDGWISVLCNKCREKRNETI